MPSFSRHSGPHRARQLTESIDPTSSLLQPPTQTSPSCWQKARDPEASQTRPAPKFYAKLSNQSRPTTRENLNHLQGRHFPTLPLAGMDFVSNNSFMSQKEPPDFPNLQRRLRTAVFPMFGTTGSCPKHSLHTTPGSSMATTLVSLYLL